MIEWLGVTAASGCGRHRLRLRSGLLIVAFWFLLVELAFLYLILRFRKKDGVKAQYITGELKHEHRWIAWPHYLIMVCDVVIVAFAIKVWYEVKQNLPEPDAQVRIVAQQWAWSFVHPGADGRLDTADDVKTVDELHLEVGKTYHYLLEVARRAHSLSIPVFRQQDAIPDASSPAGSSPPRPVRTTCSARRSAASATA
jgi:cytochrome c oxidase subunit 2